mmetsp:Transcript_3756/g.5817  ORF Transcript_3756/g.5817 Transcript_3756/m.5817 type:complete len:223 (+) Transcript_3756:1854-2522(+)
MLSCVDWLRDEGTSREGDFFGGAVGVQDEAGWTLKVRRGDWLVATARLVGDEEVLNARVDAALLSSHFSPARGGIQSTFRHDWGDGGHLVGTSRGGILVLVVPSPSEHERARAQVTTVRCGGACRGDEKRVFCCGGDDGQRRPRGCLTSSIRGNRFPHRLLSIGPKYRRLGGLRCRCVCHFCIFSGGARAGLCCHCDAHAGLCCRCPASVPPIYTCRRSVSH